MVFYENLLKYGIYLQDFPAEKRKEKPDPAPVLSPDNFDIDKKNNTFLT